ncbi:hypothetical protein FJP65_12705 [Stenotrophomonas maltophilia]|nr:hypothetical protein FJP65_12705 [Stenotrophomonas maltophilia]
MADASTGMARVVPKPNSRLGGRTLPYPRRANDASLELFKEGKKTTLDVASHYRVNGATAMRQCLLAGIGVARVPMWLVDDLLESGELRVLPERTVPSHSVTIMTPYRRLQPMRVRSLVDFLTDRIQLIVEREFLPQQAHDLRYLKAVSPGPNPMGVPASTECRFTSSKCQCYWSERRRSLEGVSEIVVLRLDGMASRLRSRP